MRNFLRKYGIVLFLVVGIAACSRVPKGILSEKEMQHVLSDMLLGEAMVNNKYKEFQEDSVKEALFESIFRKHGIPQEVYDSSLIWYGKNLDIYMKVYDRVIADYNKRIAAMGDVQAEAGPSSNRDSIDIWPRRPIFIFHPDAVFNGIVFNIKPESDYSSGSSFVLGLHVWGLREGLTGNPVITLHAEQRDTVISVQTHITEDGYHEAVLETMPTRRVRRVFGSVRMENMDSSYYQVYLDSLNLMKYNYGTEIPVRP